MQPQFAPLVLPESGSLVLFALTGVEGPILSALGRELDQRLNGTLVAAANRVDYMAKPGKLVELAGIGGYEIVLLVGLGRAEKLTASGIETAAATAMARLQSLKAKRVTYITQLPEEPGLPAKLPASGVLAVLVALAAKLRAWRFETYLSKDSPRRAHQPETLVIATATPAAAEAAWPEWAGLAEGVLWTRELVSEPGNILHPESFADRIDAVLRPLGVDVEILGPDELARAGMNGLLAVARGSARQARLVRMRWNGLDENNQQAPVGLVGKGVTFDSGGINLKPADMLHEMKWDMGGAGAVVGVMRTLAATKAKAHVVASVALVENMPSSTAQRPGDVIRLMSGKTVEVINTDAEGRLILADAMWDLQTRDDPVCLMDFATLTGACLVALGFEYAALFANDDHLAEPLLTAAAKQGEKLWRMPLDEAFEDGLNSNIADLKNLPPDRWAGSVMAAQFLQRFVKPGVPWAHFDIAGTAWNNKGRPLAEKGATGYGVRMICQFIHDHFAKLAG